LIDVLDLPLIGSILEQWTPRCRTRFDLVYESTHTLLAERFYPLFCRCFPSNTPEIEIPLV
jgi:hypothetical protein